MKGERQAYTFSFKCVEDEQDDDDDDECVFSLPVCMYPYHSLAASVDKTATSGHDDDVGEAEKIIVIFVVLFVAADSLFPMRRTLY